MWNLITRIKQPKTLADAVSCGADEGCALFAGGTYLVVEKPKHILVLVDINHLIDDQFRWDDRLLRIGAGATLQQLVLHEFDTNSSILADAAGQSCASIQIRNQRTVGGEIARNRSDSELLAVLHVLRAKLEVAGLDQPIIPIHKWEHSGIITAVFIDFDTLRTAALKRFAVLDSAHALVLVAGAKRADIIEFVVTGHNADRSNQMLDSTQDAAAEMKRMAAAAGRKFQPDHMGSVEYKERLIQTGLERVLQAL